MNISIITPKTTLFKGGGKLVQVPGAAGAFQILENHAPLISTLEQGKIKVRDHDDKDVFFEIVAGFIQVKGNNVVILVED